MNKKISQKAKRISVSIPEYMHDFCTTEHVSPSKTLQRAIIAIMRESPHNQGGET